MHERNIVFRLFFGKQLIENKLYFIRVFCWLKIVFRWPIFYMLLNIEKYEKYLEDFPTKQINNNYTY